MMGLILRFLTHLLFVALCFRRRWLCLCRLLILFCIFFVFFEKNLTYMHLKIFISHDGVHFEISNICSLLLCVSENGGCAVVTERRQLLFFLRRCCWLVHLTTPHLCVSFFDLYALWLVFNTAVAFILIGACGDVVELMMPVVVSD